MEGDTYTGGDFEGPKLSSKFQKNLKMLPVFWEPILLMSYDSITICACIKIVIMLVLRLLQMSKIRPSIN